MYGWTVQCLGFCPNQGSRSIERKVWRRQPADDCPDTIALVLELEAIIDESRARLADWRKMGEKPSEIWRQKRAEALDRIWAAWRFAPEESSPGRVPRS